MSGNRNTQYSLFALEKELFRRSSKNKHPIGRPWPGSRRWGIRMEQQRQFFGRAVWRIATKCLRKAWSQEEVCVALWLFVQAGDIKACFHASEKNPLNRDKYIILKTGGIFAEQSLRWDEKGWKKPWKRGAIKRNRDFPSTSMIGRQSLWTQSCVCWGMPWWEMGNFALHCTCFLNKLWDSTSHSVVIRSAG